MFLAIIPFLKEINYSSSPVKKTSEGRGGGKYPLFNEYYYRG